MSYSKATVIYTIGHSTHSLEQFIQMLLFFEIKNLVDIRRFPGSRKFPQFNQENLKESAAQHGIQYIYLEGLGGRRKEPDKSIPSRWRNASFRGYAAYMNTADFDTAILQLQEIASKETTIYMCSEAVWWRCHRTLVSDYLKVKGWQVEHIMSLGKCTPHSYTSPAQVCDGTLSYSEEDTQNEIQKE